MATIPETLVTGDLVVDRSQVAVIIPTYNAGKHWTSLSDGLRMQGLPASQILIVDSSSEDGTRELAEAEGYQVFRIDRCDFNHGGTRKLAVELVPWASVVVYLTQDAVLATPDAVDLLLSAFEDRQVAAAYGCRGQVRDRSRPMRGCSTIRRRAMCVTWRADTRWGSRRLFYPIASRLTV
jgi:glycosyltransferase involved in cell wall biosynthesis